MLRRAGVLVTGSFSDHTARVTADRKLPREAMVNADLLTHVSLREGAWSTPTQASVGTPWRGLLQT